MTSGTSSVANPTRAAMGTPSARRRTTLQTVAAAVAALFLVVGIAGFIPGITTHYSDMEFAGHRAMDPMLLGLFCVSVLHNVAHLLFGVAGLAMARTIPGARAFLIGGGVIYLVLALYGVLIDQNSKANFLPMNTADNWLHLFLGLGMVGLGAVLSRDAVGARR